jgi:hypothetical protein
MSDEAGSYRVIYEDGEAGMELPFAEMGDAFAAVWRVFHERRSQRGRVQVVVTDGVELTLLDMKWSVGGLERDA